MNQIDIDRYNEWSDEWKIKSIQDTEHCKYIVIGFDKQSSCYSDGFYEFITNPTYGWREMFDNSEEYQKEFWEWITLNKYGEKSEMGLHDYRYILCNDDDDYIECTPQMLTGYIIEFMESRT